MFRRIFELDENVGREGFQASSAATTTNAAIGTYFSQSLPNYVPTGDPKLSLASLTNSAGLSGAGLTTTTERAPVLPNEYAAYGLSADLIASRQAACENMGAARDSFDHLQNLANSQDPASKVRCGWMYNTNSPQRGTGAFGVNAGPFMTKAPGNWMWDLQEAKKKVHLHLCREVKDCGDIDAYPFQGRCGFCKVSGKGIPIENGRVAYPTDPNAACSPSDLILSGNRCPRPDPVSLTTPEGQAARQPCDPLPNGNLTRDCLIQKAKQSGCSEDGTLIAALKGASDLNYIDRLKTNQAYNVFQSRAAIPLNESMLQQGKLSVSQALTEFGRINDQAASTANSGLAFAARDLCLNAGEIDKFDFCVELADTTRPPFSLDCLQKEFLRAGGQRSGSSFPTNANIVPSWNSLGTWKDVKSKIAKLKDETKSSNRLTQETAMMEFLGVKLDDKSRAPFLGEPGCEIFYFTHNWRQGGSTIPDNDPVFLGRRIRTQIPFINQDLGLQGTYGEVPNWGKSFVYITNIKVNNSKDYKISITGDDGYATTLNRPFRGISNGRVITNIDPRNPDIKSVNANEISNTEISNVNYHPPKTTNGIWFLRANTPNVIKGFWFQGCCGLDYRFLLDGQPVNPSETTLTQEAYGPMLNFEPMGDGDRSMYGLDFMFGDRRLGDLQMKWITAFGRPSIIPIESSRFGLKLSKSLLDLPSGTRIQSKNRFKMTSFTTFTTCCIFNSVPNNRANVTANWHFFSQNEGAQASFQIRMYGTGDYRTGELALRYDYQNPQEVGGPSFRIETGVAYLVMIRINKSGNNFSSMELCLGKVEDLKKNPNSLIISQRVNFSNQLRFEDVNNALGRIFIVQGETPMSVAWVRMYDYYLDGNNLQREANDNWLGLYETPAR